VVRYANVIYFQFLIDEAGPVQFVVEGEDLRALAEGRRLVRVGDGSGWASTL